MTSGAGFQMHAIKSQKDNRRLLKKADSFDHFKKNSFINAPEFLVEVSPELFEELRTMKHERIVKESKLRSFLVLIVSTLVAFIIIAFLFLSGR